MGKTLPHGAGINSVTGIAPRHRAKGKPAFGLSLIVAVTHANPVQYNIFKQSLSLQTLQAPP
jgi:hypothetical protein